MESRMRQPCLVEMQVFYIAIQSTFDGFGVVQHAIISGLRQRQNTRLHLVGIHPFEQRIVADFFFDRFG